MITDIFKINYLSSWYSSEKKVLQSLSLELAEHEAV